MTTNNSPNKSTDSGKLSKIRDQQSGVQQVANAGLPNNHFLTVLIRTLMTGNMFAPGRPQVVRRGYSVNYRLGYTPELVDILFTGITYLVQLAIDPGKLRNELDRSSMKQRIRRAVFQDMFRPIWFKLTYPDAGRVEYERMFQGTVHWVGSAILLDLILEEWPVVVLGDFGVLNIRLYTTKADFDACTEKFPEILDFVKGPRPFRDTDSSIVLSVLKKYIPSMNIGVYSFRKAVDVIPAIGDIFFYPFTLPVEPNRYVYWLHDDRRNLLSTALNYLFNTHMCDDDDKPIGVDSRPGSKPQPYTEDAGSALRRTFYGDIPMDSSLVENMYGKYDKYSLDSFANVIVGIYTGSFIGIPDVSLGWKGDPSGEISRPGGSIPSGGGGGQAVPGSEVPQSGGSGSVVPQGSTPPASASYNSSEIAPVVDAVATNLVEAQRQGNVAQLALSRVQDYCSRTDNAQIIRDVATVADNVAGMTAVVSTTIPQIRVVSMAAQGIGATARTAGSLFDKVMGKGKQHRGKQTALASSGGRARSS